MSKNTYSNINVTSSTSAILVVGGGNGGGGSGVPYYTSNGPLTAATDIKSNSMHVKGDAVFEGNITWQDRDIREWFESVESRLAILQPNPELEKEWEELAKIRTKYVELERKLMEQQRIFDILKKQST